MTEPKVHMRREMRVRKHGLWTFACGQGFYVESAPALTWQQFVWLPKERQCGRCLNAWRGVDRHVHVIVEQRPVSATWEMVMVVEELVHAFFRIFRAEHEHRCHHRQYGHGITGMSRCTWHTCRSNRRDFIGTRSWLDVINWWYPVAFDEKRGTVERAA